MFAMQFLWVSSFCLDFYFVCNRGLQPKILKECNIAFLSGKETQREISGVCGGRKILWIHSHNPLTRFAIVKPIYSYYMYNI